ncbi:hypothetical protein ACQR3P_28965 [Rhodococcus sp. IEGM1300]
MATTIYVATNGHWIGGYFLIEYNAKEYVREQNELVEKYKDSTNVDKREWVIEEIRTRD